MSQLETYDVIILGSGQGGKRLAWHLGRSGKKVAVVERQWVGGSCSAVACLPTKNVIRSAQVAHIVRNAAHFGTFVEGLRIDMARVLGRKRDMVEKDVAFHFDAYRETGIELILGIGRFTGLKTIGVALNDGGTRVLSGNEVVLNVGSHAAVLDIPGLSEARPLTHIETLDLDEVPTHLIILGGGFTGIEFAQAFRRFGSQVTVLEPGARIMAREDVDITNEVSRILRHEGVEIVAAARATKVGGMSGESVTVTVDTTTGERKISGSHILSAAGRVPNTADLGLKEAGISLTPRGTIQVDDRLRTTAPGVWAMGEAAGSPQFTHASVDDFRVVRDNMAGMDHSVKNRLIPYALVTDPLLARVGLSENEAQRLGIAYRLAKLPMTSVLRAITTDETQGFMKVLVGSDDRIIGFTMLGAEADNVMATVQTAMLADLPFQKLRDAAFAHPTMVEGIASLLDLVPPSSS
jgi:pyruvate/2-oxoglutarate dehydrogenase complex dihydrolipoamide dehydrogenase (E3) component